MYRDLRSAILSCLVVCLAVGGLPGASLRAEEPQFITASVGQFDVFNRGRGVETAFELGFAPRRLRFLPRFVPALSPIAGMMGTSRGTLYAFGGFRFDIPLSSQWTASPSLVAGLFYEGEGRSKDLGGPLEFRSTLELSYRLKDQLRLGVSLSHLSNAGFHSFNPGSESLALTLRVLP